MEKYDEYVFIFSRFAKLLMQNHAKYTNINKENNNPITINITPCNK